MRTTIKDFKNYDFSELLNKDISLTLKANQETYLSCDEEEFIIENQPVSVSGILLDNDRHHLGIQVYCGGISSVDYSDISMKQLIPKKDNNTEYSIEDQERNLFFFTKKGFKSEHKYNGSELITFNPNNSYHATILKEHIDSFVN